MDFKTSRGTGNRTSEEWRDIMAQQLQKECFICHQQVYLSKPSPDSKWIKTNLDGSEHVDPTKSKGSYQQTFAPRDTPEIREAKITANLRTEAIAKAHEENIKANADLTQAVNNLSSNISTLIDLVGRYLERMH